jgi:hypothetical protein
VEAIPGRYRHVCDVTGNYEDLVISGTTYLQLGYAKSGELWLRNEGTCMIYATVEEYEAEKGEGDPTLRDYRMVLPLIVFKEVVYSYSYMYGEFGPLSRELGDSLKGDSTWYGMAVTRDMIGMGPGEVSIRYHRVKGPTSRERPQPTPSPSSGPP